MTLPSSASVSAQPPDVVPMARFFLSEIAEEDLDVIHGYICADSPEAADRVQEAIIECFDVLARNPKIGRLRHFGRRQTVRSWVVTKFTNYVIFYRDLADNSGVEIVRVLHGKQDLDRILKEGSEPGS